MQKQRKRISRRGSGQRKDAGFLFAEGQCPPAFVPTISVGHKFRFISAGAFTSVPITRAMLLNLYTMATTTTVQDRLFTAVKLRRIRMYGQPTSLSAAPTNPVIVEWLGSNSPSTLHSDTALGFRPAYVSSVPPVDSSDRWWSISGTSETDVLCKLSGPTGTIVDVDLSLRFADDEAAVAGESGTAAGSIAGTVYWNYLDGFASKKLAPVGGVTVLP